MNAQVLTVLIKNATLAAEAANVEGLRANLGALLGMLATVSENGSEIASAMSEIERLPFASYDDLAATYQAVAKILGNIVY